jgi:hypothetical protein
LLVFSSCNRRAEQGGWWGQPAIKDCFQKNVWIIRTKRAIYWCLKQTIPPEELTVNSFNQLPRWITMRWNKYSHHFSGKDLYDSVESGPIKISPMANQIRS